MTDESAAPRATFHPGDRLHFATIGGDGVGPQVVDAALRVLDAVGPALTRPITVERLPYGADHYLATGVSLPPGEAARLKRDTDAILVGALGDARVPNHEHARDILLGLRSALDLYVNERPARLMDTRLSPLRDAQPLDLVIFRENTEGLYSGRGRHTHAGLPDEEAVAEEVHTRRGVERIVRHAFAEARARGRRRVTLADKANAVEAHRLWRRVFAEVAAAYPEIEADACYADALAMDLVRFPHRFDVIVANNFIGDVLSDLTAALIGGPGVAPSMNHHPGRRSAMFEPVHGSAPTLVGTNRANPLAAILSLAMLLHHCHEAHAARLIDHATRDSVAAHVTTPDLGGDHSTDDVTRWIARRVEQTANDRARHA